MYNNDDLLIKEKKEEGVDLMQLKKDLELLGDKETVDKLMKNDIINGHRPAQMHNQQHLQTAHELNYIGLSGPISNCTGSVSECKGELSEYRGEEGPVLTREEWEEISARTYRYAIKDLKIKKI